jgi:outer membrane protein assembly factor BamC
MYKFLLITSLATVLGACNYLAGENGVFRDRVGDYLESPILPAMVIPEELDSYTLDQLYVIPEQVALESEDFEGTPRPKPIETRRREGVIIQNLGDRRWIVLDAVPAQVWPLVRDYWTQLEVVLDYENPSAGIMETSWLEVENDQETRNKYRMTIEPGLHSGYSEIYVRHLENLRSEPIPSLINWPENSSSFDQERQVLTTLSQYLADRNDVYQASSASLLAGSIEAERKVNIIEDEQGEPLLELRLDYARAWVLIRSALEAAEIPIDDSDRDQAFFNVRFSGLQEDEDKPGFIRRIFSTGNDDAAAAEKSISLRLLQIDSKVQVVAEALEATDDQTALIQELLLVISDNLT